MTNTKKALPIGTKRVFHVDGGSMVIRAEAVKTTDGYEITYATGDYRIVRRAIVRGRTLYRAQAHLGTPSRTLGYDLKMSEILEMALSAF